MQSSSSPVGGEQGTNNDDCESANDTEQFGYKAGLRPRLKACSMVDSCQAMHFAQIYALSVVAVTVGCLLLVCCDQRV